MLLREVVAVPERIIALLTGVMPEPILPVPHETWKTLELTGDEDEFISVEFVTAWNRDHERLFRIGNEVICRTEKYTNMLNRWGTGVIIPKEITQKFGIRMNHYLEVILKKVTKKGQEIEIFPEREVFEHVPLGFQMELKIE